MYVCMYLCMDVCMYVSVYVYDQCHLYSTLQEPHADDLFVSKLALVFNDCLSEHGKFAVCAQLPHASDLDLLKWCK